jgi:hypothetical protein
MEKEMNDPKTLPKNYRDVDFDSCHSCKYYKENQTIELGSCIKWNNFDVTYGFHHICDDFISREKSSVAHRS